MERSIKAGLVSEDGEQGAPRAIWVVADTGWIFEARVTNATQFEYHGFPVLPRNPMAQPVYHRFKDWVAQHSRARNVEALKRCAQRYGFGT